MAQSWVPQTLLNIPSALTQAIPFIGTSSSAESSNGSQACSSSRPTHWANDSGTLFRNPWPESSAPPAWNEYAWPVAFKKPVSPEARRIAVRRPDFDRQNLESGTVQTTWLGHASVLIQIPLESSQSQSYNILADPVMSTRAGPTQLAGIRRDLEAPCAIHDLPDVHAVVISHNHYDHLDHGSIMQIHQLFPNALFFVPLCVGKWLVQSGIPATSVRELDWWTHVDINPSPSHKDAQSIRFTCVPAQHNSGRIPGDAGRSLWAGWVMEHFTHPKTRSSCVYFAGDTGYRRFTSSKAVCPVFTEIGRRFGPIDLSFLPIWRGGSLGFISYSGFSLDHDSLFIAHHSTPQDAVDMHRDVRSRCSVPIHFATFVGSQDETLEATSELVHACQEAKVSTDLDDTEAESRFGCLDIGQQFKVQCIPKSR